MRKKRSRDMPCFFGISVLREAYAYARETSDGYLVAGHDVHAPGQAFHLQQLTCLEVI